MEDSKFVPEILAPAGDKKAFLAALAAGADAVYAGLKHFSARMEAANFSMAELAALADLAHSRDAKLYVAMNTAAKPHDPVSAGRLIERLSKTVLPDALIMADPGLPMIAREAGYTGEIHVSTLANVTHPAGLMAARRYLAADRVILPRELSIDEIRACANACPRGLSLEVFVHGALCFGVSGRCYWSSFFGGKSGLRGRCVQPCRRVYAQKETRGRLFSCQDFSVDVLVKILGQIPEVTTWKIEGRKKGPHYVYHTVAAYRLLRDLGQDAKARKEAQDLLGRALGRPATHYRMLPQRSFEAPDPALSTGSGKQVGEVERLGKGAWGVRPAQPLYPGDLLRVGYEDQEVHQTVGVRKKTSRGRVMPLPVKGKSLPAGAPVFLIDRRLPLVKKAVAPLEQEFQAKMKGSETQPPPVFQARSQAAAKPRTRKMDMHVYRDPGALKRLPKPAAGGVWLSPKALQKASRRDITSAWWWLPPVIWPDEEKEILEMVALLRKRGAFQFVLNSPWQRELFPSLQAEETLLAGPFCNVANGYALAQLYRMGFDGAFASPEFSQEDYTALAADTPMPLGLVVSGLWPLCISRTWPQGVQTNEPFLSPRKEVAWAAQHGQNLWMFANRPLDLTPYKKELAKAGYALFAYLHEPWPKAVPKTGNPTVFNWKLKWL